jgi:hypothetical protein
MKKTSAVILPNSSFRSPRPINSDVSQLPEDMRWKVKIDVRVGARKQIL